MIENNGDTGGLTCESHGQVPGATSIGLTVQTYHALSGFIVANVGAQR